MEVKIKILKSYCINGNALFQFLYFEQKKQETLSVVQGLQDSVQDDGALLHKGVETHKGGLGLKLNLMLHPCIQQYTR